MILNFGDEDFFDQTGFVETDVLACVSFRMEIGDLIDSEITQIIPIEFAKDIVNKMMEELMSSPQPAAAAPAAAPAPPQAASAPPMPQIMPQLESPPMGAAPPHMAPPPMMPHGAAPAYYAQEPRQPVMYAQHSLPTHAVSAQPAQFQSLDITELAQQKENIGIIMDVPLEVTVELGRTSRKIREILEFTPGTIVDLDKLAGEPIDILVNGKFVATGEVVVVDENFAVRVVDIVNVDKRI
jgi:flagellar motor switch protein FliN/FliY